MKIQGSRIEQQAYHFVSQFVVSEVLRLSILHNVARSGTGVVTFNRTCTAPINVEENTTLKLSKVAMCVVVSID